jgi:hypothetical protein
MEICTAVLYNCSRVYYNGTRKFLTGRQVLTSLELER